MVTHRQKKPYQKRSTKHLLNTIRTKSKDIQFAKKILNDRRKRSSFKRTYPKKNFRSYSKKSYGRKRY